MDIAKIRKKALSKKNEQEPVQKTHASAEDEKKGHGEGPAGGEGLASLQGDFQAAEADAQDEGQGGVPAEKTGELVELLTFSLSREEFAFNISEVEEIIRLYTITRIPAMPDYMLGITSLRGKIIPVIDLKTKLNLQETSSSARAGGGQEIEKKERAVKKMLVIAGPKGLIGATVDRVIGVVSVPRSEMREPPGHLDESGRAFLEGIVVLDKRFISVIRSAAAMDIEVS
jgi:purine-binding chemotaxis protein CheW